MPPLSPSRLMNRDNPAAHAAAVTPLRKRSVRSAFFDYSPSPGSDSNGSSCPSSPASPLFESPLGKMTVSSPKRRVFDEVDIDFDGESVPALPDQECIPNARFAVWGKKELLALRYTQKTVLSQTADGQSLKNLTSSLAKGWDCNSSNALTVIQMPDGQFVSMDNRRLFCLKKIAGIARRTLAIPVSIHDYRECADKKYLTPIETDLKKSTVTSKAALIAKMKPHGIREDSYGFCAYARMRVFEKEVPDSCFGFTDTPIVRK